MSSQDTRPALGGVFRCAVPIRWGDLDAQNHVNNTVYFRYFEEARVQLFRKAGMTMATSKVGLLVHASCDFMKPLLYPDTVVVHLILTHIGRTSLHFDTIIERQDEVGEPYAKGKNVIVGANPATGKPEPWTSSELAGFALCFENTSMQYGQ